MPRQEPAKAERKRWRDQPWWPWAKRLLSVLFIAAVLVLLVRYGRNVDWDDVLEALRDTPAPLLLLAVFLTACSHLLYSSYDLIGRRYTGHKLSTRSVMGVTFVSYAFNLSLGSLVGGVGFRYRLYSRLGLKNGTITRILTTSMVTNWFGYMLLAGTVFVLHPLQLPPNWKMGNHGLQWLGGALIVAALAYLVACWRKGGHTFSVRGHEFDLPHAGMAALQLAVGVANWSLMAGVVYVLLGQKIAYSDVLSVLLIGGIAGVIAHVPAGLGVLEFIFVALLAHQMPESRLIAGLLAYRAIYYIAPLILATVLYIVMEAHARKRNKQIEGVPA